MKKSKSTGTVMIEGRSHLHELDEVEFLCSTCRGNVVSRGCLECRLEYCDNCGCEHKLSSLDEYQETLRISTKDLRSDFFPSIENSGDTGITNKASNPNEAILSKVEGYIKNIDGALKHLESREKSIKEDLMTNKIVDLEKKLSDLITNRFELLKYNISLQNQDTILKIDEEKEHLVCLRDKTKGYYEKALNHDFQMDMTMIDEILSLEMDLPTKIENLHSKEHHLMLQIQSEMFSLNNDIQNICVDLTRSYQKRKLRLMDRIYCLRNVKSWVIIFKVTDDLISMNPKDYVAWSYRAEALSEIGRVKEADQAFETVFSATENTKLVDDEFARGRCHFILKEYRLALKCFVNGAAKDHVGAQFNLGYMYSQGLGVTRNNVLAAKLYHKSAQGGFANAQYNLGLLYYHGIGVERNYEEAISWYYKSAKKGLAMAQSNLAVCYFEGIGTTVDYPEAIKLYKLAAGQGLVSAQFNLAHCYYQGTGVAKNYNEAYQWFMKAALGGLASAQYSLGVAYEYGHGIERDREESMHWYNKAALQNHSRALEKVSKAKI